VTGAEQLVELELWRGFVERIVRDHVRIADDVLGRRQHLFERRAVRARNDQLETRRRHFLGDLGDFGVGGRNDDDPGHALGSHEVSYCAVNDPACTSQQEKNSLRFGGGVWRLRPLTTISPSAMT